MSDNLVPEPQSTIFDAVNAVVGNEDEAQAIIANPSLAKDILGNDDASAVKSECCGGHGVQSQDHECGCEGGPASGDRSGTGHRCDRSGFGLRH